MAIVVRRVYEPRTRGEGYRVLVDRIWPRGITKEAAAVDLWLREAAPSDALRRWFAHEPARWEEFQERYFAELDEHGPLLAPLGERAGKGRVTLLFGAKEERFNNAVALKRYLEERLGQ